MSRLSMHDDFGCTSECRRTGCPETEDQMRTCCFIPEHEQSDALAGNSVKGCTEPARWTIRTSDGPDDYTDSCTAHVGEMLSDAYEHKVYPIEATA